MNVDDLFTLIKSLSETDKKFFRQYASLQSDEANYLKLFNFIDSLETYDDEVVKDHFKSESFVKQLSVAKNYLNEVILRTFRISAEKESPEIGLQLMMMDCRFLLSKKCLNQLKKALKRAKKLAEEQENFLVLMNIYGLQRHLLTEFRFEARENITLDAISIEESATLKKIENVNIIYDLYCKAKLIITTNRELNVSDDKRIEFISIFEHPLMAEEGTALSVRAKHWFHSAHHFKNIFFPGALADYENCKAHLELFRSNPLFALNRPLSYMTVINNMLEVLRELNKLDEVEAYIELLSGIKTNNDRDQGGKLIYLTHHYMWYYMRCGKYAEAVSVADSENLRLKTYTKYKKDSVIYQLMMIAIVYITAKEWDKANNAIYELMAVTKSGVREDILEHTKMLQLIVQVALKQYDIAAHLLRSIKRSGQIFPLMVIVADYYTLVLKNPFDDQQQITNTMFRNKLVETQPAGLREFPEMVQMLDTIWK